MLNRAWEKKIGRYRKTYKRHGTSIKALAWKNEKTVRRRYLELLKDISIEGKSILDFGCGMGGVIPILQERTNKFSYVGVDMVEEFVKEAKNKYLEYKFILRNYLEKPLDEKFDIVLASGSLNSNFSRNVEFRKKAVKILFEHCKEALAFNMAGSTPQPKNKKGNRVYYADALEIYKYCRDLSKKTILRQNYLPKDFTIVMYK